MTPQIEKCAARMPEPERSQFLATLEQAKEHFVQGVQLRRLAWGLYRMQTGAKKRDGEKA